MQKITLPVETRTATRKGPARRLRAQGKAPAIFYGPKTEPIKIAVDAMEFGKLTSQAGTNPIFDLQIKDNDGTTTRLAAIKERQIDPIDGTIIHMDFVEIFMDVAIEVNIPLRYEGKAIGIERGGLFQASMRDLFVSCLPANLPDAIVVDISSLDWGDSIHVKDLPLLEGIKPLRAEGATVCSIVAPKRVEEEAEEAAEEEVAEEGGEKTAAEESE
jgi:large subunit ribosomal protein L25